MATSMIEEKETQKPADEPWLGVTSSSHLTSWLAEQRISLSFTTYQAGKLFLVGQRPDGRLSGFERTFSSCMGLWADDQTLWMSSKYQLWRFENALKPGYSHDGYDRVFIPKIGYTTGGLAIHDVVVESGGRVVFVNTAFNCLATLSERYSFRPLWRPPFVSELVPEDRCHLNGLTLVDGRARYATAVSLSDVVDGWRDQRHDGGCVVDVQSNAVVATGLSMPHSPRFYQGRLWLLNSGTGHFGYVDLNSGRFQPVQFCPGYLRGLAFVGNYAVVGLSSPRHEKTFGGLDLDRQLESCQAEPECGLQIIDLRSGEVAHWLRFEGLVTELYDVAVLPGVVRPMALGFKTDDIERFIAVDDPESI